jgi:hypothetical protein
MVNTQRFRRGGSGTFMKKSKLGAVEFRVQDSVADR